MEMTGLEWKQGWWQDVPKLISQTDVMYRRLVEKGRSDKVTATKTKIYEARGWEPCRHLIDSKFEEALTELNFFYVPKGFLPGPCFVFPQKDLAGQFPRAQTRPLYDVIYTNEDGDASKPAKYCVCGCKKEEFKGPIWLGNQPRILQKIIECGWCIIVEGPFDLLACRLLAPDVPVICSMTKNIGLAHQAYLRMLGVKTIYLMYDNERPKKGKDAGEGSISMRRIQKEITWAQVEILLSPAEDASACLKSPITARRLKSLLYSVV